MGRYLDIAQKGLLKKVKRQSVAPDTISVGLEQEDAPMTPLDDPEVVAEANAMLIRNPFFGWTWEQALSVARRIIAFKRGQKLMASPTRLDPLVEMTPTGCPGCKGLDYWVTAKGKHLCVDCNDGRISYRDVVAMGRIERVEQEARRPSMRRRRA